MPTTTGPKLPIPIPPVTPREPAQPDIRIPAPAPKGTPPSAARVPAELPEQPDGSGQTSATLESTPGRNPPSAARAPAELVEVIAELREEIAKMKLRRGPIGETGPRGPQGEIGLTYTVDADCTALAERVGALERMLTPDASGHMTGLPPIWATFRDVETGQQWTAKVYLGDGFRDTPPKKITPSLRGEGR